jgi:membrane fusion protein (multidrug efflux system)
MQRKRRKPSRRLVIILLLVLVAAGGGLYLSGKLPLGSSQVRAEEADSTLAATDEPAADDAEKEVAVPVELAEVQRRSIAAYYRSASTIEADRLVDLVAKVTGRIQAVNVEEGDWVEKGRVLAEIENEREKIQLRQAELRLAEQSRQLERNQAMVDEGLISREDFDKLQNAHDLAVAERDLARISLEERLIRAPFDGQVTERKIVLGQQVAAAAPTFTLADFQPLRVKVHLPENVARKVVAGQRVLVSPEAVDDPLEARVERIAPVVDPATSTVRLTLELLDGRSAARVGGFVKVRITTDTHQDAVAIPKLALVEEGALRSVFVAEADTVRKVEINTGLYDETHVEILDGVEEGQFVVTMGQGGLREGSRIDVLNAAEVGWGGKTSDLTPVPVDPATVIAKAQDD